MRAEPESPCGLCGWLADPDRSLALYESELWSVRHLAAGAVPGWLLLVSRRHVAGLAHFDEREAAAVGPMLRHCERVLERITGAERIYTAALGEAQRHFHAHMVPRYATMAKDAKGWAVFDLERAANAGEIVVDYAAIDRVCAAFRQALRDEPPPS